MEQLNCICPLCLRHILLLEYDMHLAMHERAEILADLLALSRR